MYTTNSTYVYRFFVQRNEETVRNGTYVPFLCTKKRYIRIKETVCMKKRYVSFLCTKIRTVPLYEEMVRTYRFFVRRNDTYIPFLRTKKWYKETIRIRTVSSYIETVQRNDTYVPFLRTKKWYEETECICGASFTVEHAFTCPHDGYPSLRHNEIRDITAQLMSEVCSNVATEPTLQPVTNERFYHRSANTESGACSP